MTKRLIGVSVGAIVCLLSAGVVSGCTATTQSGTDSSASTVSTPTPEPTVRSADNPGKPVSCDTWSAIRFASREETDTAVKVWLEGPELADAGPLEFAVGEVGVDDAGRLATYTVAAGDAGFAIGERFCVDYITLFQFNHVYPVPHPGDVLVLHVDESVPFPVDPIAP